MPCSCDQCVRHARALGMAAGADSKEAIHKAYRDAVKLWHPDRFASDPDQQTEAEEKFKRVQVAYRALTDHYEHPVDWLFDPVPAQPAPPAPKLSFGKARGCYTAPRLPAQVEQIIAALLEPEQKALAIVDLSRNGSHVSDFSQFLLLASHAVIVRDSPQNPSILWYSDLGEINLIDQSWHGKLGLWEKMLETISGGQHRYSLRIFRRSGAPFYTIAGQADDSVKKVIYNFLLRKKYEARL